MKINSLLVFFFMASFADASTLEEPNTLNLQGVNTETQNKTPEPTPNLEDSKSMYKPKLSLSAQCLFEQVTNSEQKLLSVEFLDGLVEDKNNKETFLLFCAGFDNVNYINQVCTEADYKLYYQKFLEIAARNDTTNLIELLKQKNPNTNNRLIRLKAEIEKSSNVIGVYSPDNLNECCELDTSALWGG